MRGIIASLVLLLSAAAVFAETSFNHETFKQLISSSSSKVTPLNAASCSNLQYDIDNKCHLSYGASCKVAQDYVNCAVGYVNKDCGYDQIAEFCRGFYQGISQYNIPCTLSCNSATTFIIYSSIGAALLYKMLFEKCVFAF